MPEKIMLVTWKDGADLSKSRLKPDSYSPLARDRDTHDLSQVTLSDVDENDESDSAQSSPPLLYVALTVAGLFAASKAAPYVRQWLEDSAVPAVKESRDWIAAAVGRGTRSSDSVVVVEPVTDSSEVTEGVDIPGVSMSSAEWQEHFRLMLLAGAVQDEQWRLLSTARVEDGDVLQVQQAMQHRSAQQVAKAVRAALESNHLLLDPETVDEMLQVLARSPIDASKRALRLGE